MFQRYGNPATEQQLARQATRFPRSQVRWPSSLLLLLPLQDAASAQHSHRSPDHLAREQSQPTETPLSISTLTTLCCAVADTPLHLLCLLQVEAEAEH